MKSYSLFIGCRRGRRHFLAADDRAIREITARYFPNGLTILSADGAWYDQAENHFKHEEARQILICTGDKNKIAPWCDELSRALGQKELLVVELGPAVMFASGNRQSDRQRKSQSITGQAGRTGSSRHKTS